MKKIKVLVIDDSAVVRNLLSKELSKDPEIEVIGTAADPFEARDKIEQQPPDVITLDIEMPRMDGITFLKRLMEFFPLPVVIVSSLTPRGSELAFEALAEGAVEIVSKENAAYSVDGIGPELIAKVKVASKVKVGKRLSQAKNAGRSEKLSMTKTTNKIVAIGASTGGVRAIQGLLAALPHDCPGIVLVQHLPGNFSEAFVASVKKECQLDVAVAKTGDVVRPGRVLIAPGNYHMCLNRSGSVYEVALNQQSRRSYHRPSVDVLFESVADYAGRNAVGVILTGMGSDGAEGLLRMHRAGAKTIAQDEESSVIFGMPKEAINKGAVDYILPLNDIPAKILKLVQSD